MAKSCVPPSIVSQLAFTLNATPLNSVRVGFGLEKSVAFSPLIHPLVHAHMTTGVGGLTPRVVPLAACDRPQAEQDAPVAKIVKLPDGVELVVETVSVDVAWELAVGRLTRVGLSEVEGP